MQNGSYVYHEMAPDTRRGTITNGEMHNGNMRYIFHLDPRFSDAAAFGEVYYFEYELVECPRPTDVEIAAINKLVKLGS
jgi:hypothetical protein